uniref:Uncharacterized protein n=1 Tax=Tetraselmis sp. GSL018 TaxID=582737 RepID=A0A061QZS8_9CHLO
METVSRLEQHAAALAESESAWRAVESACQQEVTAAASPLATPAPAGLQAGEDRRQGGVAPPPGARAAAALGRLRDAAAPVGAQPRGLQRGLREAVAAESVGECTRQSARRRRGRQLRLCPRGCRCSGGAADRLARGGS